MSMHVFSPVVNDKGNSFASAYMWPNKIIACSAT